MSFCEKHLLTNFPSGKFDYLIMNLFSEYYPVTNIVFHSTRATGIFLTYFWFLPLRSHSRWDYETWTLWHQLRFISCCFSPVTSVLLHQRRLGIEAVLVRTLPLVFISYFYSWRLDEPPESDLSRRRLYKSSAVPQTVNIFLVWFSVCARRSVVSNFWCSKLWARSF